MIGRMQRELQMGLSPRVRGNLTMATPAVDWKRSIPACAGEPVRLGGEVLGGGVYPRVCGGTWPCCP